MKYESTAFAFPSEYLKYFMSKKAAFFSTIRIKNSPRHGMLRIHGQGCFLYSAGMGCTKDLIERKGFMSSHARIEKSRTNSDSARVRRHSGKKKRNKFLFLICITFTAVSYTHLDVYKRQMLGDAGYGLILTIFSAIILKKYKFEGMADSLMRLMFLCGISTTV